MRSSSEWKATTTSRPPSASTRSEAASAVGEFVELAIDEDAERLERAGRRMDAVGVAAADRRAPRCSASSSVPVIGARFRAAAMAARDGAGPLLLAEDGDHARQVVAVPCG